MRLLLFSALLLEQYFSLVTCSKGCNSLIANYEHTNSPLYVEIHGCLKDTKLATIKNGNVEMEHDQSVLIGCPLDKNEQKNLLRVQAKSTTANVQREPVYVDHIVAKCNNGQIEFSDVGPTLELNAPNTMTCQESYFPIFKYTRSNPIKFNMSFEVPTITYGKYSVKIMDGMIDSEDNALFTHISMQPEAKTSSGRPGNFKGPTSCPRNYNLVNIEESYNHYLQSDYINQLIGANPPDGLRECLEDPKIEFGANANQIVRGHLTANADFVTIPERAASFYYLNAAPQWQITNGANFARVEHYVRRIAHRLGWPLDVYTGTHGNARVVLDGNTVIEARSHTLRIPEVFWKIIYDPIPTARSALVFIVFNSPCPWNTVLLNELQKTGSKCNRTYCNNVKLKISATPKFDVKGLVFCCESVMDASDIFDVDGSTLNELKLLPSVVQNAKPYKPVDENNNDIFPSEQSSRKRKIPNHQNGSNRSNRKKQPHKSHFDAN